MTCRATRCSRWWPTSSGTSTTTTSCAAWHGWPRGPRGPPSWPSAWPSASGAARGSATRHRKPTASALPAIALAVAIVSFGVGVASNVLSREVEASADVFSLDLTRDPAAHIALERRLAISNLADPDPPRVLQLLFGTHPTTRERIGIGEAWAREH